MDQINSRILRFSGISICAVLAALAVGCITPAKPVVPKSTPQLTLQNDPRRENFEAVLILMPLSEATQEVYLTLKDELIDSFDVIARSVTDETTPQAIGQHIQDAKPSCLVLMDNRTVHLYRSYQLSQPSGTDFPTGVVVMTSYLGSIANHLDKITGIAYEIPEVTVFRNLRTFLDQPVRKIGVLYRKVVLESYIREQMKFAAMEQFETIPIDVGKTPTPADIRRALTELRDYNQVDAIWVLNDNALFASSDLIAQGWLAELNKKPLPVVVGVTNLVQKDVHFGAFAMVPDHSALGVQTANLIYELADEDWEIGDRKIEQPLSVKTVIDYEQAVNHLNFKEEMIDRIDIVIR